MFRQKTPNKIPYKSPGIFWMMKSHLKEPRKNDTIIYFHIDLHPID